MIVDNALYSASWLKVKQMMNTQFRVLHLEDTLRTVIMYYQDAKYLDRQSEGNDIFWYTN